MLSPRRWFAAAACPAVWLAASAPCALAQVPENWRITMQTAHSPVQAQIESLNGLVSAIIIAIVVFVAGLMGYTIWRFHHTRNQSPSRTSHNTVIEIAWTVIPVLILVIIAIPSFRLVFYQDRTPDPDMTLKVTGHQWYWEYNYPDNGGIDFASYIVPEDQLKPGQLRLLTVDNQLVLPAGKKVRILTTSADVIHSFFIPSLGVQRYAIPGRTIETWVEIDKPGDYVGECNQICGTNHNSMPISVHALSPEEFQKWLGEAKTKFAAAGASAVQPPLALAQADRPVADAAVH